MKQIEHLGINGLFLRKVGTGIGQVTQFTLLEMAKQHSLHYTVYVDDEKSEILLGPNGKRVVIEPWWQRDDLIRKTLWEHIQLPKRALRDKVSHFLSLYQAPTEMPGGVDHLMIVHDVIPEIFSEYRKKVRHRFFWNLTKRAIQGAEKIVSVSASTKRDLVKRFSISEEKITVAHPSINPLFFTNENQKNSGCLKKYNVTPGFLYHGGGLEIRKNTENVLTSYAAWRQARQGKDVPDLVITGAIHDQGNALATNVYALREKLKLEKQVHLLGFVPVEDLKCLYQNASLFLFPSLYEGFGMPVVEALSQGTAVLTFKNSSLPEVGGEAVFWTEELNKEVLEKSYEKANGSNDEEKMVRKLQAENFKTWSGFTEKVMKTLIQ